MCALIGCVIEMRDEINRFHPLFVFLGFVHFYLMVQILYLRFTILILLEINIFPLYGFCEF